MQNMNNMSNINIQGVPCNWARVWLKWQEKYFMKQNWIASNGAWPVAVCVHSGRSGNILEILGSSLFPWLNEIIHSFMYLSIYLSILYLKKKRKRKKIVGLKGQRLSRLQNTLTLYNLSYEIQGKKYHSAFVFFMQWFLQNQS